MHTATLPHPLRLNSRLVPWFGLILCTFILVYARDWLPWAIEYPKAWVLPLSTYITTFMKWLINDFDLGLFTFKEFTRALAWIVEQPYSLAKSLLSTGFLSGVGSYAEVVFPRLSWVAVIAGVILLGHYAGLHGTGWRARMHSMPDYVADGGQIRLPEVHELRAAGGRYY